MNSAPDLEPASKPLRRLHWGTVLCLFASLAGVYATWRVCSGRLERAEREMVRLKKENADLAERMERLAARIASPELVLKDRSGAVRWQVALETNGAVVESFFDASGRQRVYLGVDEERTSRLRLYDGEGVRRIAALVSAEPRGEDAVVKLSILGPDNNGRPITGGIELQNYGDRSSMVSVFGDGGNRATALRVNANNESAWEMFDLRGQERFAFFVLTNGMSVHRTSDHEGRVRTVDRLDGDGDLIQIAYDLRSNLRQAFMVSSAGHCEWALLDARQKPRIKSAVLGNGGTMDQVLGADGKIAYSFGIDPDGEPQKFIYKDAVEKTMDIIQTGTTILDVINFLRN